MTPDRAPGSLSVRGAVIPAWAGAESVSDRAWKAHERQSAALLGSERYAAKAARNALTPMVVPMTARCSGDEHTPPERESRREGLVAEP
jgi:hypothetical protein